MRKCVGSKQKTEIVSDVWLRDRREREKEQPKRAGGCASEKNAQRPLAGKPP
jgi:hypothetical protein